MAGKKNFRLGWFILSSPVTTAPPLLQLHVSSREEKTNAPRNHIEGTLRNSKSYGGATSSQHTGRLWRVW